MTRTGRPIGARGSRPTFAVGNRGARLQMKIGDIIWDRTYWRRVTGAAGDRFLFTAGKILEREGKRRVGRGFVKKTKPRTPPGAPRPRKTDPQLRFRNLISRWVDKPKKFVIAGNKIDYGRKRVGPTVPEVHEHGKSGPVKVRVKSKGKKLSTKAKRAFKRKYGKKKVPRKTVKRAYVTKWVRFPVRDTMQAALKKGWPGIMKTWDNALNRWSKGKGM